MLRNIYRVPTICVHYSKHIPLIISFKLPNNPTKIPHFMDEKNKTWKGYTPARSLS